MKRVPTTEFEHTLNKVIKYNQQLLQEEWNEINRSTTSRNADIAIETSRQLLQSLVLHSEVERVDSRIKEMASTKLSHRPVMKQWEDIVQEAHQAIEGEVYFEDILTPEEITKVLQERDEIERLFAEKTSILNSTDLSFLMIATALQVTKTLLFPYVAQKFNYGDTIDQSTRLNHDNKEMHKEIHQKKKNFQKKEKEKHGSGEWQEILFRSPAYDITKGSPAAGIQLEGKYHRLKTLGHDPILGWIFGTMNILTDTMTVSDLSTYIVERKPTMKITPQTISVLELIENSYHKSKEHKLNLPAALFAQGCHLKSDENTKLGLPVPLLSVFNENLASDLYKSNYDFLCFRRDSSIIGGSLAVSVLLDTIINITHSLFRQEGEDIKLYSVRTRKILLISNMIASTSSIIASIITKNIKTLDIGGRLFNCLRLCHLF